MRHREALDPILADKFNILCESLAGFGKIAVAFSGGVDSTLLLKVAHDVLGNGAIAITGKSPSIPEREIELTRAFCAEEGIEHVIIATHEFDIEGFKQNPPDRCYWCKRELLSHIHDEASKLGIWTIAEGSNVDDEGDYRPGLKAVRELDVVSPLRNAGMTKGDIRSLARFLGLSAWNKPAYACLNTRFEYGDELTEKRLSMVDQAEDFIIGEGFQNIRVRMKDSTARIEVPEQDIERITEKATRHRIVAKLKDLGFAYISVDLQGYRTGSMNETL